MSAPGLALHVHDQKKPQEKKQKKKQKVGGTVGLSENICLSNLSHFPCAISVNRAVRDSTCFRVFEKWTFPEKSVTSDPTEQEGAASRQMPSCVANCHLTP